jgi:hypothetical protein
MTREMMSEIVSNLGYDEDVVRAVVAEFALQLHRRALEYRGGNGDFIGEELWPLVDRQTFYHLLGFLSYFATRYGWDENSASEYLLRLGSRADWAPFRHQMAGWQLARPKEQESPG